MKIYREVLASDRLPNKEGFYPITWSDGEKQFLEWTYKHDPDGDWDCNYPDDFEIISWLEEVEMEDLDKISCISLSEETNKLGIDINKLVNDNFWELLLKDKENSDSTKILPVEERYNNDNLQEFLLGSIRLWLHKYNKALEASEQQVIKLQVELKQLQYKYDECKELYQNQSQELVEYVESFEQLQQEADEKFNNAIEESKSYVTPINRNELNKLIKLAAYGNK